MSAILGAVGIRRPSGMRKRPPGGHGGRLGRLASRAAGALGGIGTKARGGLGRRRHRGISGAELRGFKKVARLLADFGMRPRGLAHPMHRRRSSFSRRRRGDPEFSDGD